MLMQELLSFCVPQFTKPEVIVFCLQKSSQSIYSKH